MSCKTDLQIKRQKNPKHIGIYTFVRINLLIMTCLTLLNLIFLAFNLDIALLFSALIPYFTMFLGVEYVNADITYGWIYIIAAIAVCIFYFLCYVFSLKNIKWFKAAFICFLPDAWLCVYLFLIDFDLSGILSMLFMLWMLLCFILGLVKNKYNNEEQSAGHAKLK